MSDPARLALAAHLHILMRRHLGRNTDAEWLAQNREYAEEIVRLALASTHPDLHDWAQKLKASFAAGAPAAAPPAAGPRDRDGGQQSYVGRLR